MTAAGRVVAARRSMRCGGCGLTAYPADDRIGLDGFLSPGAVRLACLAAASWSFDVASDRLDEMAGVRVDDETIRRHVHRAAAGLAARREAAPPPAFAAAEGDREFLTDGVMAPTRDGWREVKMARFQARPAGEPAGVADWAGRELPRADGERRLCDDGRRRGVLGPVGRLGDGAGDRPGRPADGAGRRGGLDLVGGGRALPGGRPGAGHLPRLAAHRRGGRRPARRGDARGGRLAGAGAGPAPGRRLAGAAGPPRRHADGGPDALGPGGDRRDGRLSSPSTPSGSATSGDCDRAGRSAAARWRGWPGGWAGG